MDVSRILLAAVSLVCGLILLIVAGRRQFSKRSLRPPLALSFYGLLFMVTAFLIWNSRLVQRNHSPIRVEALSKSPIETHDTLQAAKEPQIARIDSTKGTNPIEAETRAKMSPSTVAMRTRAERELVGQIRKGNKDKPPSGRGGVPVPFEDRAYLLVSRAFDAVEQWFLRNGSPVPAKHQTAEAASLEIPTVSFEFGTAELSSESQEELSRYARYLSAQADPALIEIQAFSNEGGMEPFNYILTQARAEAVRNVLVENGVSTSRLLPVARGSEGTDSLGLSSHVRFVTHP